MVAVGPRFVLVLIACVLFAVSALWAPPAPPRFNLVAAGLFFFSAAWLFAS
jgi:hypothetical protein